MCCYYYQHKAVQNSISSTDITSSEHAPGLLPVGRGPVLLVLVGVLPRPVDEHALVLTLTLRATDDVPAVGGNHGGTIFRTNKWR